MKKIRRFFTSQDDVIKAAKSRAATRYRTQLIYSAEQGFYIREIPEDVLQPLLRVLHGGVVQEVEGAANEATS